MTTPTQMERPRPVIPGGAGNGAVRDTRNYYDAGGRRHTAAIPVPVDQYGKLVSARVRCSRCKEPRWVALVVVSKGNPVCEVHDRVMVQVPIPTAPLLPWSGIRTMLRPYVWPVLALVVAAVLGAAVGRDASTPALLWAGVGAAFAWAVARTVRKRLTTRARVRGHLDADEGTGRRLRETIARRARTAGSATAVAGVWLAVAAQFGDPHTLTGRIVWTLPPVLWLPYAATYWRWVRSTRARRESPSTPQPEVEVIDPMEPNEALVMHTWDTQVAVKQGQMVPTQPPPGVSTVNGKRG